jgi:hypothetical protein
MPRLGRSRPASAYLFIGRPPAVRITYNTGTSGDSGGGTAANQQLTIPAGVLGGDLVLFVACGFNGSAGATLSASSTGTTPVLLDQNQTAGTNNGIRSNGAVWAFTAAGAAGQVSSDAGKVITITCSSGSVYWSAALGAWTGVAGGVDVHGGFAAESTTGGAKATPAETTGAANDWAVYLAAMGLPSGNLTEPAGTASRVKHVSGTFIGADICDSNGSVGPAGTSIGGAGETYAPIFSANTWYSLFTVGLALIPSGGATVNGAAALSASPVLSAAGVVTRRGAAALSAAPALTAAAVLTCRGTAALAAAPALTAGAVLTRPGQAHLAASPSLTAPGIRGLAGTAHLAASPALTATGQRLSAGQAHLAAASLLTAAGRQTALAHAALAARASLQAYMPPAGVDLSPLWNAYLAAQAAAHSAWQVLHMNRQAGGSDGTAGFMFSAAYQAQAAADAAYEAWQAAQQQAFPGARG